MVTFAEISPSELKRRYESGMSIKEVARSTHRSYFFTRERLLAARTVLRSKKEGTNLHIQRHPEWKRQFVKYEVKESGVITDEKILLLTMIITEGYFDRRSFGFCNVNELLNSRFEKVVRDVYGPVNKGKNGLLSRVSSTEISTDVASFMHAKTFGTDILRRILHSEELTTRVLRIVADTEGSILISPKRARRNWTVEFRIVLSSKNMAFSKQIAELLRNIGIYSTITNNGVQLIRKRDIRRLIEMVGFSPGVKVVRRKDRRSLWYGHEKMGLAKLFLKICEDQEIAKKFAHGGSFADCKTRRQTVSRLAAWYLKVNGGDIR